MTRALIVQHKVPEAQDGIEDLKLIGAYSCLAAAQAAVERLRSQPGFRDYPDYFSIDEYEVDRDHWTEGFVAY
jgi:hypothetical protein